MTSFATTSTGTRIAYFVSGREWRPPLVLTHSLGSDHDMWDPQIEALKDQYYIIAIDNLGHGQSEAPGGEYTVNDLAAVAIAVADAAELEQFHYCGLSVGGLTGLQLAVHHTDRLLSLTLCNTGATIGTPELWDERIRTAKTSGMAALVDAVIARWFSPDFAERQPQRFARARATLVATDPDGYAGVCAAIRDADLREDVGSIAVPTLVIGGENDEAAPIGQSRWLHDQIAGSHLVELNAAHISNLDREPEFTAALSHFLSETTP